MSSELQSAVSSIVDNDYVTLVILTAVGYDYILTLSEEIEYIWNKPWTRVSTLFVLVRYFGLCGVMIFALFGSSFLPASVETYVILIIIGQWAVFIFDSATDLAMILRVWAIYAQSRIILGILLTLYALEIVLIMTGAIITSIKATAVIANQVLDFSFCVMGIAGPPILGDVVETLQSVLSAALCLLVVAQFIRQALQMYRVTKQWQLNRYMNLFVREGIFYFFAIFLYALANLLFFVPLVKAPITGLEVLPVGILQLVPVYTLSPRFILSVRALYAHDVQGHALRGIDSDFGFTTSVHVRSVGGIAFAPAYAGQSEEEGLEHDEEIQVVERETQSSVGSA